VVVVVVGFGWAFVVVDALAVGFAVGFGWAFGFGCVFEFVVPCAVGFVVVFL